MSKETIAEKLRNQTITYKPNPYWYFDKQIYQTNGKPLDITKYQDLFETVREYFKLVYLMYKSEAQVLVLSKEDGKLLPDVQRVEHEDYDILVLPQKNSYGRTQVSDVYWQTNIVDRGITPFMRIHSHHVLPAYQSKTDWESLNSGSLEVVLGDIFGDMQIAYWLDTRGSNTKDHVYKHPLDKTTDYMV